MKTTAPVSLSSPTQNPTQLKKNKTAPRVSQSLRFVLLTLCVLALLCWRLGAESLNDWDEAIYAQVAKEIVASGDWLTLHWGYEQWFHKPPLFMWATALFFKLFEVNEFWARFPSVLAGTGLVGCTYLIAIKLNETKANKTLIGLLSAVVLLTNYTFVHFSRFGTTDIALTFFSYLAIYAYLWIEQKRWAWCGVWAAIALAVMTKGVAGLGIAITLFLTLLFTGRLLQAMRSVCFWLGVAIAVLIILPWHWAMLSLHGTAFIDQYLFYHVVERSTGGGLEGNEGGLFYYFGVLANTFFPWVYLLPFALFWALREWIKQPKASAALLLPAFVTVIFGGFSLAGTKLPWYIIPVYPGCAIAIGSFLVSALSNKNPGKNRLGQIGLLLAGTAVMVLFPSAIAFLSESQQQFLSVAGLVGLVLLSVVTYKLHWPRRILSLSLCSLFLIAGLREIKGSYHGYERPIATLSQTAKASASSNNPPLLVGQLSTQIDRPTPLFYSDRPITRIRSAQELAAATASTSRQDILLAAEDIEQLKASYDIDIYAHEGELTYAGIRKRP